MASRTIYTSTVTVPVYASWKCEHCGELNFSTGVIAYRKEQTTRSWSSSVRNEVKARVHRLANAEWVENAYYIITDPNENAQDLRSCFTLQNTRCKKCGKKPRWDKNMNHVGLCALCIVPALISGIVLLCSITSFSAWLVFAILMSIVVYGFVTEPQYRNTMAELPKEYTPIIGSLNSDIIKYASQHGILIPTPDECISIARSYCVSKSSSNVQPITFVNKVEQQENSIFCRKCGVKLHSDSQFCHKCGTEIIR